MGVTSDKFEVDPAFETRLAFPCCVCLHRHGTDRDEPCIRCENNLNAQIPDDGRVKAGA